MTPTVIVTRPLGPYLGAEQTIAHLQKHSVSCIHLPVLAIRPIAPDPALTASIAMMMGGDIGWLILLSPTAVHIAHTLVQQCFVDRFIPAQVKIAVQGRGTGEAVRECFMRTPDLLPDVAVAEELADAIVAFEENNRLLPVSQRALVLQAKEGRNVVGPRLKEVSWSVFIHAVYETVSVRPSSADIQGVASIGAAERLFLFMSPSSVRATVEVLIGECPDLYSSEAICVGPTTATAARAVGFTRVVEAHEPSEAALVSAVVSRLRSAT